MAKIVTAGTESKGQIQELLMNQQNSILHQHHVNVKTLTNMSL